MNKIIIQSPEIKTKISRHIYGHFAEHLGSCIYGGIWVGNDPATAIPNTRGMRNDVVAALKRIKIPNLRWPGGCFADEYHWKDGIGQDRPKMVNTHWGGVTEDNSFGTHEFLELCDQLSEPSRPRCEPYICGNVGSGTVQELSQWVEYCNFDGISPMADLRRKNGRDAPWNVRYWGIGNENWGCGGNMSPAFYADNFLRYACYARNYGQGIYRIACGSHTDYYDWTKVLMEKASKPGCLMNGLSYHYYTVPGGWTNKGSALDFSEFQWRVTMEKAARIDEYLRGHIAIMDQFDPDGKVGMVVDEWGCWHDVEPGTNPGFLYQQNSLRDALAAGIYLNAFNNHAERVFMANIAQMVNVLQSLILTDGPKMILTPTYHVFDMYQVHHDALKLPLSVESEAAGEIPALNASASMDDDGAIHISLVNVDPAHEMPVEISIEGFTLSPSVKISGQIISSQKMNAHNDFENPDAVKLAPFSDAAILGTKITANLPPKSMVTVKVK